MSPRSAAARIAALSVALFLLPATVLAQGNGAGVRLSNLAIEIWPEYDRPAALVILRGTIAEGVRLPASVSVRLPATLDGPVAVAFSTSADGSLLNLPHDKTSAGAFTTVKFEAPERYFHVEFYEPMATANATRKYTYTWPGDLAVERASVVVQEPASAQGIVTDPVLGNLSSGAGGLGYRAGDVGALPQGKEVPIAISYTKTDARPSVDIKGLRTAQGAAPVAAAPPAPSLPAWVVPMAALAAFAFVGVLGIAYLWRRRGAPPAAGFCVKCGAPLRPGDKYCGKCGARSG